MDKYIHIFVHIPKTGGSTFIKHIEKNVPRNQRLLIDYKDIWLGTEKFDKKKYAEMVNDDILKINKKDKDRIRIIYGHMVPYGIHKLFQKSPRYVVFLRDPEKRLISFYNYLKSRYVRDQEKGVDNLEQEKLLQVSGKVPDFRTWLEKKYSKSVMATDSILQLLEKLGYFTGVFNKKEYIKTLNKFYYIGITRNLAADLDYLLWNLGFKRFFINQNISRKYVKSFVPYPSTLPMIRKNQEFFEMAIVKRNQIIQDLNLEERTRLLGLKRKLLTPITQIIFDLDGFFVQLSAYLRNRSQTYKNIFDWLRGYPQKQK